MYRLSEGIYTCNDVMNSFILLICLHFLTRAFSLASLSYKLFSSPIGMKAASCVTYSHYCLAIMNYWKSCTFTERLWTNVQNVFVSEKVFHSCRNEEAIDIVASNNIKAFHIFCVILKIKWLLVVVFCVRFTSTMISVNQLA